MPVHHFHLVVDRPPSLNQQRALTDLPMPPRSATDTDGACVLAFDRPATTLADALATAIDQVERADLRVVRVAERDGLTLAEIGERIGRSREIVRLWALGKRGPGGFPAPLGVVRETSYYSWSEVLPWLRDRLGYDVPDDEPIIAAANLALQLRALAPRVRNLRLIRDLLAAAA